ncbi:MAG: DUF5131 family protein [Candidatus Omnitrophota bacterium]|jgi:protein gp37
MNKTTIEWVFNADGSRPGYSVNPMTGCLNQVEGLCKGGDFPCYAYRQSHNKGPRGLYKADMAGIPACLWSEEQLKNNINATTEDSFDPRVHIKRFDQLLHAPKNAGVFVDDRSDWAASYWPRWCQDKIIEAAVKRPDIRLYLLTKQPQELQKFSPFPDNVWPGVTLTLGNDNYGHDCPPERFYTLNCLKDIKAKVKFISFEPLLGQLCRGYTHLWWAENFKKCGINWVIIGAQTKPIKYPDIEWVKEIVTAADEAGAKVFLKDNLYKFLMEFPYDDLFWEDISNMRQEIPEG